MCSPGRRHALLGLDWSGDGVGSGEDAAAETASSYWLLVGGRIAPELQPLRQKKRREDGALGILIPQDSNPSTELPLFIINFCSASSCCDGSSVDIVMYLSDVKNQRSLWVRMDRVPPFEKYSTVKSARAWV